MSTSLEHVEVYESSVIRARATRSEMELRRATLLRLAEEARPASVRHLYYRAVVAGLVPKTKNGYVKVQRMLVELRRSGELPYDWIVDNTRYQRRPNTWWSASGMLTYIASTYRRSPWPSDGGLRVEIWCESDSLAGTLDQVGDTYDVPIFPTKGQSSDTFAWSAARSYYDVSEKVVLLYAGDFDPAGLEAESQLSAKLREHSNRDDIQMIRLGVTQDQAAAIQALGTTPKKTTWKTADGTELPFPGLAVEGEAVEAPALRGIFSRTIRQLAHDHFGYDIFAEAEATTEIERNRLREISQGWLA